MAKYSVASPLVSIGVPLFNEQHFLAEALVSLLTQDYSNTEIIVSDNASTDATQRICEDVAKNNPHVKVIRSTSNAGAAANFQRCLDAANGEFFMWAAGHDLWSTNLVSQCVGALEQHTNAVIAVPESQWVDVSSQPYGERPSILDTRGMDPLARIFSLLWANMHPIYGVMRTAALRATGQIPNYSGADLVLLSRMILQGDFIPAPGALWSRRQSRASETYADRQQRYKSSEAKIGRGRFPLLRLAYELMKTVWSSRLSVVDKLAFTLAFPAQLPARYLVARRRVA